MKKHIILIALFITPLFSTSFLAQARNDYIWVLGYPPNKPEKFFGGVLLDFNQDIMFPQYFNISVAASAPAVLSTNEGQLLAYSNGCKIMNADHELMMAGDSINFGEIWDSYCEYGYPGTQHNLLLPWPGQDHKAMLFHVKGEDNLSTNYLLYSIIEFTAEYPMGVVTEKNTLLLTPGGLSTLVTATRHGNGRDWWLIFPEYATNRFYSILFDDKGVSLVDTQSIGSPWGNRAWASQAVFSPDGSKYIRFNPWKGLDIFDFDRCSGRLSNIIESGPLTDPLEIGSGVGISPNSRFLYASNSIFLYQFDLLASDILASKLLIDSFDGYQNPFSTTFYQMMLAPDGKIYMFASNGVKSIHVIHHPDRQGLECDFVQHGLELPAYVKIGSINFPYYRLGPADGSICDTLGINNLPIADFRYEVDPLDPLLMHFRNLSYFEPVTYSWSFGNNLISNVEDPLPVDYDTYGVYEVCLTATNIHGSNTFCRMINLQDSVTNTGVVSHGSIEVTPNPFSSELFVTFSPSSIMEMEFDLYTILGIPILTQKLTKEFNMISIPGLPSGLYMYRIKHQGVFVKSDILVKVE